MTEPSATPEKWFTRGVGSIGAASSFSDAGHEITTSVLPTFLTSTLHTGPGVLGAIDGVSNGLIGLSKLAGGSLSNDPTCRARLASGGFLWAASTPTLAFGYAAGWLLAAALAARFITASATATPRPAKDEHA